MKVNKKKRFCVWIHEILQTLLVKFKWITVFHVQICNKIGKINCLKKYSEK